MTWRTATTQPAAWHEKAARRAGPRTHKGVVRLAAVTGAVLAAVLTSGCGPSKPAAPAATGPHDLDASCRSTKTDAGMEVTLAVSPCPAKGGGSAGKASVTVKDAAGKAVEGAKVEVNSEMPNMKMKGGKQSASAKGDGYESKLVLGMPGDWRISVVVTPASGQASTTVFNVKAE
ncbi:FixH family protein [Streptomyces sp. NPDC002082]|uniref:FixH family protein n=1 Tax=Streptomyces sp. NPDC002082 TaxID=3154772 RepID=UPI00331D7076